MSEVVDGADWPVVDLHEALRVGRSRGGHLLTCGEGLVVRRILALAGPPARVYARLVARKPLAFPLDELTVPGVDDVPAAVATLCAAGLADGLVPWSLRAELLPARRLVAGCRRLGLRATGSWRDLADRLAPHTDWDPSPWVRPRHRGLVRRLQRWAALRAWPRPEAAVLERMELQRWPSYPLTRGPALHPTRAALRRWEGVHGNLAAGSLTVEQALQALQGGHGDAPGRLSLRRALGDALARHARELERADPEQAVALYERLDPVLPPTTVAFRRARALEACGRATEALEVLKAARRVAPPRARPSLWRAARRLGRSLRVGVAPDPPLASARAREVVLQHVRSDDRPLWRGAPTEPEQPVEEAVITHLASRGREAHHVEGRLFRTLAALLLAELYFLPVPGQLPVPRLAGPLDLGTPAFRARRAEAVDTLLASLQAGHAVPLLTEALPRWEGVRLAGRHDLDPTVLLRVADALAPSACAAIVEHLLDHRSRGLPDLVVLPGPRTRVTGHPARVGEGLLLVEVKGPGDTLSDDQLRWHDLLLGWQVPVEVWNVVASTE